MGPEKPAWRVKANGVRGQGAEQGKARRADITTMGAWTHLCQYCELLFCFLYQDKAITTSS